MKLRYDFLLMAWTACCVAGLGQTDIGFPLVGNIKPRAAREIAGSTWSIGGETLDRDFAVYANYKKYLGPLGAKGIRLQAGWAKCEKQKGVYDWQWLDEIIDDAVAQGVRPWVETSYGNTIYEGGGGTGLAGGLPTSPEALTAWDKWVRALVRRYQDRVKEWEVWNEPDISKANTPEQYTTLFIRTAQIIRTEQPGASIWALGLAHNLTFADKFLELVKQQDQVDLIDAITIHGYPRNPDDTSNIDKLRAIAAKYSPTIEVRQGETGAPSKFQESFALSKIQWSETTQAKWNLRRMLAHHAKDVPVNLFTMSDMHYIRDGKFQMNYKGLLGTNPNQTISHVKPAYHAAQRVFAVFDHTLERIPGFRFTATSDEKLAVVGYRKKDGGAPIIAVWFNGHAPIDSIATTPIDFTFHNLRFNSPVYVDLLTGQVYALPSSLKQVPICDSPILIAEKSALPLEGKSSP